MHFFKKTFQIRFSIFNLEFLFKKLMFDLNKIKKNIDFGMAFSPTPKIFNIFLSKQNIYYKL